MRDVAHNDLALGRPLEAPMQDAMGVALVDSGDVSESYRRARWQRIGRNSVKAEARLALAQRIALAALAIFLMLNAVTPFITPDPPWLANLPLVVAIIAFLLAFGLSHIRAERARAAEAVRPEAKERPSNGPHEPMNPG